jgi:hypothetical protein
LEIKNYFGNNVIFKDIISELIYLETHGIFITSNNKVHHIYFSLGLIIGDNLGLHSILGFTKSFVANYPCRFCKTEKIVCHTQILQVDINLRNITNYTDDLIKNDVSLTGIKEPCVWNKIDSFPVTDNYSVDVMHDMLEGVCNYDTGLMLKRMIFDLKYFSLNVLYNRIELFDYGPIDIRNRPTLVFSETLKVKAILKMSASEMLCFVKNLGLMIGDLVPRNSEIWTVYIIADKILNIILSKCITFEDSFILENLITEHHETYLKIFRNKNLKPKHHHMVHYPLIL